MKTKTTVRFINLLVVMILMIINFNGYSQTTIYNSLGGLVNANGAPLNPRANVGINNNNPCIALDVIGSGARINTWNLDNCIRVQGSITPWNPTHPKFFSGSIIWDKGNVTDPSGIPPLNNFVIGGPGNNPPNLGNYYFGLQDDPCGHAVPPFIPITEIYGQLHAGSPIPTGSFRFDQWVLLDNSLHNGRLGVGMLDPQNYVEIGTTNLFNTPNVYGGTGFSGLRFRDLTSLSNACTTIPTRNVLSVDGNGDVILIPGGGLFGLCSDPSGLPLLPGNEGLDFNESRIYLKDPAAFPPATQQNDVGIGWNCGDNLIGKLDVKSKTKTTAVYDFTHRIAGKFYETGDNTSSGPAQLNFVGVYGETDVTQHDDYFFNLGGDFYASNAFTNIGARGTTTAASSIFRNIGLQGNAANGPMNVGVQGIVDEFNFPPPPVSFNAAVYGDLVLPPAVHTGSDWAGYFNGDVFTTTAYYPSDINLKRDIQDISNPMSIINKLNPKSYLFKQQENQAMNLPNGVHYGLISQEVENILPGLVKNSVHPARYDSHGNVVHPEIKYKALNYTELIPFLIAGMKEQQSQIEKLQARVDNLEQQEGLNQIPDGSGSSNRIDVTLSSKGIVLNQNDPNPFKEHTIIQYFIPDDAQQVKIIFTGIKGDILKEVEISEKGKGQLNVYASDLSSGVYTYSIVANGITIDTKKMVCSK